MSRIVCVWLLGLVMAVSAKDNAADLRAHFKKAPRSVANALKQGATKERAVVFIVWHEDVQVKNGIDWWLGAMLGSSKTEKLLSAQAIITALPHKRFVKHLKLFDGKEEWSQPYILFVDGRTEEVVHKVKAYANPDTFYEKLTEGLKKWLDYKSKE